MSELLSRLTKVKQSAPNRWAARCPAHEDRSPSLAIRAESDGKILLHCFAGCPVDDVLGAIGLQLTDLFPPRTDKWEGHGETGHFRMSSGFTAMDALQCLSYETTIVLLAACDLAEGKVLSPDEVTRLAQAAGRISEALTVVI